MFRVVSSAALPAPTQDILGPGFEYVAPPTGSFGRDRLLSELASADGLISLLTVDVDDELLAVAPNLRVVANYAVGYDNVDVAAASKRGIAVTNTPDVLTETTADMTWALLLAAARRVVEGDAWTRSGEWPGWAPDQHLGLQVSGQRLGIVGLGRIGLAVARRARAFGMDVWYCGPREVEEAASVQATRVARAELLAGCDFVSLHCPLTPDTRHIIDQAALQAMAKHSVLVNTSRGGCVDEAALVRALGDGSIAAAGLDVFEDEPRLAPGLAQLGNVVLAPHAGSATTTTRYAMGRICAESARDVLSGRRPANVVNPQAYEVMT